MKKKRIRKKCKFCKKSFWAKRSVYCSDSCRGKWRYKNDENYRERAKKKEKWRYKNSEDCRKRVKEAAKRWDKRNPIRARERSKKSLKSFRKRNPKRFNELMRLVYKRNKEKYFERGFVARNRKEIIKILKNKCFNCKKIGIKEIHHREYGKRPILLNGGKNFKEKNKLTIKKYTLKYLDGFCSRKCHKNFKNKK